MLILFNQISAIQKKTGKQLLKISPDKSKITWKGKKITGKQHFGTLEIKEGVIEMKNGKLTGGEITVDMQSIESLDLEGKDKDKLENHLRSSDFFNVEKYPEAQLSLTSVDKADKENVYHSEAELTIKGTTMPVSLDMLFSEGDREDAMEIKTEFGFDRSQFNVRYGSGSFFDNLGDNLIYDTIKVDVALIATAE